MTQEDSDKKIKELEQKLNIIIEQLNNIDSGTSKMSKHIDFIEGVYNTVSAPMYWVCNKINGLRGEIKNIEKSPEHFKYIHKTKLNRTETVIDKGASVNILEQD
jgi:hypothetical protein